MCRVNEEGLVLVGDFGLARDIYAAEYYRSSRQCKVPVKWMAPEALNDGISNEKTDIVSYVCACMCVLLSAYMDTVCMHACVCVCICMSAYMHSTSVHVCACNAYCMHGCARVCVCILVCMHECTGIVCIYTSTQCQNPIRQQFIQWSYGVCAPSSFTVVIWSDMLGGVQSGSQSLSWY